MFSTPDRISELRVQSTNAEHNPKTKKFSCGSAQKNNGNEDGKYIADPVAAAAPGTDKGGNYNTNQQRHRKDYAG
jgi:hypothetical protein